MAKITVASNIIAGDAMAMAALARIFGQRQGQPPGMQGRGKGRRNARRRLHRALGIMNQLGLIASHDR
jgi:hypothetical protein